MTCTGFALLFVYMTCTQQVQMPTSTYCQLYKPVYWHKTDTQRSKQQNDVNNKVWKALCTGQRKGTAK